MVLLPASLDASTVFVVEARSPEARCAHVMIKRHFCCKPVQPPKRKVFSRGFKSKSLFFYQFTFKLERFEFPGSMIKLGRTKKTQLLS